MRKKYWLFLVVFALAALAGAISRSTVYVETKYCVGCGDCEAVCPAGAVAIEFGKSVIDPEKCIQCEICVKSCTYNAIRKKK
ncbi:MAG: 4Fe-4S dicluster domain-containing protein [Candidatus Cloacimonetes bacterium]|nr:4Fe-4S dicluster domain-containing protein [Candidatus Cloacimonadota bacterium]